MKTEPKALIWYHNPNFGLDEAHKALIDEGLTVTRQDDLLKVHWGDGPLLYVRLVRGEEMQLQIRKLAKASQHASQAHHFDAQFEITFDSLDEVLDEINTLIQAQGTLQSATQGMLYITWNKQILPFEE